MTALSACFLVCGQHQTSQYPRIGAQGPINRVNPSELTKWKSQVLSASSKASILSSTLNPCSIFLRTQSDNLKIHQSRCRRQHVNPTHRARSRRVRQVRLRMRHVHRLISRASDRAGIHCFAFLRMASEMCIVDFILVLYCLIAVPAFVASYIADLLSCVDFTKNMLSCAFKLDFELKRLSFHGSNTLHNGTRTSHVQHPPRNIVGTGHKRT